MSSGDDNGRPGVTMRDIQQAVSDIGHPNGLVRRSAEERLADIGPIAMPDVCRRMRSSMNDTCQAGIVRVLIGWGDAAVPDLGDLLANCPQPGRNAAVRALQEIGTPAARAAILRLLQDAPHRRAQRGADANPNRLLAATSAAAVFGTLAVAFMLGNNMVLAFIVFMISLTGLGLAVDAAQKMPRGTDVAAVTALGFCNEPAMVELVAGWLDAGDEDVRAAARNALVCCLRDIGQAQAENLNGSTRRAVLSMLAGSDRVSCAAALRLAPWIGDEQAVADVERIVSGRAPCSTNAGIRELARNVLPQLRERVGISRMADRLVRASSGTEEQLLRPAGSGEQPADQLVRPVDP